MPADAPDSAQPDDPADHSTTDVDAPADHSTTDVDAPADSSTGDPDDPAASDGRTRGRAVDVPLEIYKVVTVFSTLFAIAAVVVGFVLLDWGTNRARADPSEVHLGVVVAGLLAIALGAVTYAFSTRFRAEGMDGGKGKG